MDNNFLSNVSIIIEVELLKDSCIKGNCFNFKSHFYQNIGSNIYSEKLITNQEINNVF